MSNKTTFQNFKDIEKFVTFHYPEQKGKEREETIEKIAEQHFEWFRNRRKHYSQDPYPSPQETYFHEILEEYHNKEKMIYIPELQKVGSLKEMGKVFASFETMAEWLFKQGYRLHETSFRICTQPTFSDYVDGCGYVIIRSAELTL